eukprot:CAMPEP_0205938706 /NCGR_PEP_ID=MMETSP1325-20131115/47649_1 /ASSEMBLY_ACC=CAM_ASM_000708 /TAXON_ID=236786 /ORGANISM="Florenciella sp., Strain RCC1007" /LENGTH=120 /DNA_ID=CAMNT_0053309077 /DNA_START=53 /DNA_END=414 /DNA_ORIENTATION=+
MKWLAIDKLFETLVTLRVDRSWFSQMVANCRGATPMHEACWQGNLRAARWLLEKAPQTLQVKNKMGYRPVDLARKAGQMEIVHLIEARESGVRMTRPADVTEGDAGQAALTVVLQYTCTC